MRILVTGATGGTGQAIVREARAQGYEITALVRNEAEAAPLLPSARLEVGDARDPVALTRALAGCEAVVSTLGTRKISLVRQVTLMSEATRALVELMKTQRLSRLVCITGLGAGDSAGHGGFMYDWLIKPVVLRTICEDKDRQEAIIKDCGADWVIVRHPAPHRPRPLDGGDHRGAPVVSRATLAPTPAGPLSRSILVLGAGELGMAVLRPLSRRAAETGVRVSMLLRPGTIDLGSWQAGRVRRPAGSGRCGRLERCRSRIHR